MVNGSLLRAAVAVEVERPPRAVCSRGHRGTLRVGAREGLRECVSVSDAGRPRSREAGTSGCCWCVRPCPREGFGAGAPGLAGSRRAAAWGRGRITPPVPPCSRLLVIRCPAAVTVPVGGTGRPGDPPCGTRAGVLLSHSSSPGFPAAVCQLASLLEDENAMHNRCRDLEAMRGRSEMSTMTFTVSFFYRE